LSDYTSKPPIIVAIDLDGTLLPETKKVPFFTKKYLRKISKKGVKIVIASGRPNHAVEEFSRQVGSTAPVICFNGTLAYHPNDDSFPIFAKLYDKNTIKKIVREFIDAKVVENVLIEDAMNTWLLKSDDYLERFFWIKNHQRPVIYGDIHDTLNKNPLTAVFKLIRNEKNDQEILKIIEKYPNHEFRFWGLAPYGELYQTGSSKAEALREVAKFYNVDMEDIIAFGDSFNDIEMLQEVGIGIAMKNGREVVKNICKKESLHDNEHEGVKKTLRKLIKFK